jgi:hypothetical protein
MHKIISSLSLAEENKFAKVFCGLLEFFKYSTCKPLNIKCIVPAFFGDRFGGKDGGLCTYNLPAEELG